MTDRAQLAASINALVDEQRARCLWHVRRDWHPANDVERRRALTEIRTHGNITAYRKAAELEAWL